RFEQAQAELKQKMAARGLAPAQSALAAPAAAPKPVAAQPIKPATPGNPGTAAVRPRGYLNDFSGRRPANYRPLPQDSAEAA
ncbi:MAG TPA: hypothetical protein VF466_00205, partial [Candidatus Saccharimonadales bacterium]